MKKIYCFIIIILSFLLFYFFIYESEDTQNIKQYFKAAEQGDAEAQFHLGLCYAEGNGVEKDMVKATEWYNKAAEQGHVKAQYKLGVCYTNGNGVEKDMAKAAEWYNKAAKQGDSKAQYNLGVCYYKGEGVEKNFAKAAGWYCKAAEQGEPKAQFNLSICYYNGEGVATEMRKAIEWYNKAAEQGVSDTYYEGLIRSMQVFICLIDDDEKIMNDNFINVQIEYDKRKIMGKSFRDYMKWSINKETTEAGIYFDIYARLLNDKLNNISSNNIPCDAYNAYTDYVLSLENIADLYIHHPHMPEQNKVDLKYDLINPFSIRKVWVTYKYLKFLDKDKEATIRLVNNRLKIINIARKYGIHVKKEAYTGLFKEY